MGRYISTGIVFQYRFSKTEVEQQYERCLTRGFYDNLLITIA